MVVLHTRLDSRICRSRYNVRYYEYQLADFMIMVTKYMGDFNQPLSEEEEWVWMTPVERYLESGRLWDVYLVPVAKPQFSISEND